MLVGIGGIAFGGALFDAAVQTTQQTRTIIGSVKSAFDRR
jgi:hypothetical protein